MWSKDIYVMDELQKKYEHCLQVIADLRAENFCLTEFLEDQGYDLDNLADRYDISDSDAEAYDDSGSDSDSGSSKAITPPKVIPKVSIKKVMKFPKAK
jgi:hypothetical protein